MQLHFPLILWAMHNSTSVYCIMTFFFTILDFLPFFCFFFYNFVQSWQNLDHNMRSTFLSQIITVGWIHNMQTNLTAKMSCWRRQTGSEGICPETKVLSKFTSRGLYNLQICNTAHKYSTSNHDSSFSWLPGRCWVLMQWMCDCDCSNIKSVILGFYQKVFSLWIILKFGSQCPEINPNKTRFSDFGYAGGLSIMCEQI